MAAAKKTAVPSAAPKSQATAPPADSAPGEGGADQEQEQEQDDDIEQALVAPAAAIRPAPGEVFVMARKGLERFHRCGMRFTRAPTVLVVAELAEGVLDRLISEASLEVVHHD